MDKEVQVLSLTYHTTVLLTYIIKSPTRPQINDVPTVKKVEVLTAPSMVGEAVGSSVATIPPVGAGVAPTIDVGAMVLGVLGVAVGVALGVPVGLAVVLTCTLNAVSVPPWAT